MEPTTGKTGSAGGGEQSHRDHQNVNLVRAERGCLVADYLTLMAYLNIIVRYTYSLRYSAKYVPRRSGR